MSSNRYESGVPLPLDSARGKEAQQYYLGGHLKTATDGVHLAGYSNDKNCVYRRETPLFTTR